MWEKKLAENIKKAKEKKLVLFGSNAISARIMELFREYDIVGVMDFGQEPGNYQSSPLLSFEEAAARKTDIIILTKQLLPAMDVFRKLKKFCIRQGVKLWDIYGNDLLELIDVAETKKDRAASLTMEALLKEIDAHDMITWDIFDTLLMRKALIPEDVFEIVGARAAEQGICIPDFRNRRIQAQLESGLSNPDIYEIYESFRQITGITGQQKQILADLEITVEKSLLFPRKKAVEALQECKKRGKKVYLVSDMYLPGAALKELLLINGITGYDGLYVSCDEKMLKNEGLLGILPGMETESEKKALHIGDSLVNDGICAGMLGMDYCLLNSAVELMQKTSWSACMDACRTVNDRCILGLCVAELFEDPFILSQMQEKLFFADMRQFGYVIVAPVVVSFLCWLIRSLKEDQTDKILFAARDGFIVKKLYDGIRTRDRELPPSVYFYTSRKAAVLPDMASEAVVNMLIDISRDLTPGEMMGNVFGLAEEEILPWNDYDCENIHQYVWKHKDKIFHKAVETRKRYFRYMGTAGLEIGKTYAFIDFVSSGTCQKSLMKYVPFELKGYYFAWNSSEDPKQYAIKSYYGKEDAFFMENYKIIEFFMTTDEPSLAGFSSEGEAVLSPEMRTVEELSQIRDVHHAALLFGKTYFDELYIASEEISHSLTEEIFRNVKQMGMREKELYDMEIVDDWKMKKIVIRETLTGEDDLQEE